MRRRIWELGVSVLAVGLWVLTAAPQEQVSGHQRMREALRELADRSDREHPYLNREPVERLRQQVKAIHPAMPVQQQARLRVNLGQGELRLGNLEAAIENLEAGYALLDQFPPGVQSAARQSLAYHLGLAYARLGEIENCLGQHHSTSCVLPIGPEAVHRIRRGSESAMPYFREVMRLSERGSAAYLASRWLLNLAAMTLGEYPAALSDEERIPAEAFGSEEDFPRFSNIAPRLGLATVDLSGGAGGEDFNGDGLLDLIVSTWDTRGQMRYFERQPDGSFREKTVEAGLSGFLGGLNLNLADYDNDGDVDVLVLRGAWVYGEAGRHPNSLLQNQGNGQFRDVTFEAGLAEESYPTQTAGWADFDNDGDLDLYVGNEASPEQVYPSQLFRNNGDGTFTDVAEAAGVQNLRYSKGVAWGDYNEDRWPDLYVSNLGGKNRLYHNNGDGSFTDIAEKLGVTGPIDSFPSWFWDFDNDGKLDLFVAGYFQSIPPDRVAAVVASYLGLPHRGELHHLYKGDGKGFQEVGRERNLRRITLTMGCNYGDLDNDGFLDFYLGTGYPFYDGQIPNVMYHNQRGERFTDISSSAGFAHLQKGHAVVFADWDGDGDQDVFEQMGGAYLSEAFANAFYENPGFGAHWVQIKLHGKQSNRFGVGARLHLRFVDAGEERSVYRWVGTGGSFGANPLTQHIGLGKATRIEELQVFWPTSGITQKFTGIPVDRVLLIEEDASRYQTLPLRSIPFAGEAASRPHH